MYVPSSSSKFHDYMFISLKVNSVLQEKRKRRIEKKVNNNNSNKNIVMTQLL